MTKPRLNVFEGTWLLIKMTCGLLFLIVIFAWGAVDPLFDRLLVAPKLISVYLTRGADRRKAMRALLLVTVRYGPRLKHGRDGFDYISRDRLILLKAEYDRLRRECIQQWGIREFWLPSFGKFESE